MKQQPQSTRHQLLPLVSIIIPCYNAGEMIERCLLSCFQQVYPNIEIIIVDNNSTDDSMGIARRLASTTSRRVIFTQCLSNGQNHARNQGFTLAQGDYIQWLDADDELASHKIATHVTALEQKRDCDIAYGDWEWCFYNQKQLQYKLAFKSQHLKDPLRQFLLQYWHPPHAYLLRRSAAQLLYELQAWHPQTLIGTDIEYFTLAAIFKLKFLYVPGAIVRYNHWSSKQMSREASYWQRVETLGQMAIRFQNYATKLIAEHLSPDHWFLLRLNWDLWRLASTQIIQEGEQDFWLKHQQKNIGITLTSAEARIVVAMHQLDGVDTLVGHTNQIIRLFWKQAALQPGVNEAKVGEALSFCVGLTSNSQSVNLMETLTISSPLQKVESIHSMISFIPLQAPLFIEQRFAILRLLDKLRVVGFLSRVIALVR